MQSQPPPLARLLLRLRRLGTRYDDVQADLNELFHIRAREHGVRAARRAYWRDVVSLWWHPRSKHPATPTRERRVSWTAHSLWQDLGAC